MMDPSDTSPKIEVRSAGNSVAVVPRETLDLFRYGSRWVEVDTATGRTFREVPLTLEDLFDPQEGDHVTHSFHHGDGISETKERLRSFFDAQGRKDVVVCDDVKMLWQDPELDRIGPDLAVIPGMSDLKRYRKSFREKDEKTRPVFVMEFISEATGKFDKEDKPNIYCQAKVKECFLLDQLTSPWELLAYRLDPWTKKYVEVVADGRGRYLAETLGVCFSIAPEGDDLIVEDSETGELLRKPVEESRARRQETAAREVAERQAAQEVAARETAEQQTAREAEAREAVEAENVKLLAEIARLRAPIPPDDADT